MPLELVKNDFSVSWRALIAALPAMDGG
jgi:hypothetical protein